MFPLYANTCLGSGCCGQDYVTVVCSILKSGAYKTLKINFIIILNHIREKGVFYILYNNVVCMCLIVKWYLLDLVVEL